MYQWTGLSIRRFFTVYSLLGIFVFCCIPIWPRNIPRRYDTSTTSTDIDTEQTNHSSYQESIRVDVQVGERTKASNEGACIEVVSPLTILPIRKQLVTIEYIGSMLLLHLCSE